MADITFNIANENIPRWADTAKFLWEIPQIPDPDWVDPEDGTEQPYINEFTDNQWAKEGLRRWIVLQVRRYERYIAKAAVDVSIQEEDNLVS